MEVQLNFDHGRTIYSNGDTVTTKLCCLPNPPEELRRDARLNLKQMLYVENTSSGIVFEIPETVWASHSQSPHMIPSVEVSNIKRTYELELRLGFKVGSAKVSV